MNSPASETPAPPAARPVALPWPGRLALLALAAAMAGAVLWPYHGGRPEVPAGVVATGEGTEVPLEKALAPVTLVHFWATWCPPCIDEVPAIAKLARDLSSEPRFGVMMVAVADSPPKVESFLGSAQAARSILYDAKWEVAHRYGTRQLPETYLVVGGRIAEKFVGATDWNDPKVRKKIEAALEQKS
jgi:thiol-disulfide isomerase/thioredoxin